MVVFHKLVNGMFDRLRCLTVEVDSDFLDKTPESVVDVFILESLRNLKV